MLYVPLYSLHILYRHSLLIMNIYSHAFTQDLHEHSLNPLNLLLVTFITGSEILTPFHAVQVKEESQQWGDFFFNEFDE